MNWPKFIKEAFSGPNMWPRFTDYKMEPYSADSLMFSFKLNTGYALEILTDETNSVFSPKTAAKWPVTGYNNAIRDQKAQQADWADQIQKAWPIFKRAALNRWIPMDGWQFQHRGPLDKSRPPLMRIQAVGGDVILKLSFDNYTGNVFPLKVPAKLAFEIQIPKQA